jgi:CheY-like chemotaxis protein
MTRPRVLLVDDDEQVRTALGRLLRARYDVTETDDGAPAIEMISNGDLFDVVLLDVQMPTDGFVTFTAMERFDSALAERVILVTAGPNKTDLEKWVKTFPRVLFKPINTESLYGMIEQNDRTALVARAKLVR